MRHEVRGLGQDVMSTCETRVGDAVVLTVSGEIDLAAGPRLRAELSEILSEADGHPVVLDVTAVTFLSSTGLAVLVDAHWQANQLRRPFVLVVDDGTTTVRLALRAAGIATLFPSHSTVQEALRHCRGTGSGVGAPALAQERLDD